MVTVTTTGDDDGLTWSITGGNTDGDNDNSLPFAIDADTGAITVNDADDLDFETTTSHTLTVQATDDVNDDSEDITITISNVAITVTDTQATIDETSAADAAVVTVSATGDDDIAYVWSITNGNTDGDGDNSLPFAIDADTGAITVNDADDLDFETTPSHTLTVQATDGATQTDTEDITITISNVAPTVVDTDATISETAAADSAVVTVTTTGDDDGLTWSITGGNTDGDGDNSLPFAIDADTGAITVNDADDLDFETTSSYTLTVQATDDVNDDSEDITITISNVAITVTDTDATISETAAADAAVVTVSATGDDDIAYVWSITGGNTDGDADLNPAFAINSGTGAITVNDADDLDFETTSTYTLTVQATDGATQSDTEDITITISNVAITVTDTQATIDETSAADAEVVTVSATGDDDIAYVWSITGGNTDGDGDNSLPFAINSGTGAITVNDADDLDFETTSSYTLTVQATDGATQTDTEDITITISNVAITVTDTQATIDETSAADAEVVTVSATGDDDIAYVWSITNGNTDGDGDNSLPFAINSGTGAITVNDADDLDFETTSSYTLTVQATDGATQTDTEDITITISNVAPTVVDTDATISETAAADSAVVTVTTTGDDDGLTWSITGGNTDGDNDNSLPFAIDADTGAITVNDADDLDFETTSSYTLTVQATDDVNDDSEDITITISNVAITVTDTQATIDETSAADAAVVTVSATGDDDIAYVWSITGGNTDGDGDNSLPFAINSGTGAITVNDADDLDFETTPTYTLTVQATDDATQTDSEEITITISNVAPTVVDTDATISETAAADSAVVTVTTTGDDDGLTWSITGGNTDGDSDNSLPFAIDSGTGAITVNDADDLDFETTTSYTLTVQATDGVNADSEDITITISNVAPTVVDTDATISETAAADSAVVTVTTTGDDDGLTWSITGGNTDGVFTINSNTGAISVLSTDNLDYENAISYTLTVQATDGVSPDSEDITISINDVAPTVTDTSSTVSEDASADDLVVTISTTGDTSGLTWSITGGNTDGDNDNSLPFAIDADTGAITVNDADDLDYETTSSYTLTVQATDGTAPDSEDITITVVNTVLTVTSGQSGSVNENSNQNTAVLNVATTGDDAAAFQILLGNTDSDSDGNAPFAIDAHPAA